VSITPARGRPDGGLEAGDVRRALREITKAVGIAEGWTPREVRHSFVSSLSDNEMPTETIADLCGRLCRLRGSEPVHLGCMTVSASILAGAGVLVDPQAFVTEIRAWTCT
jgi:hypothetical protein